MNLAIHPELRTLQKITRLLSAGAIAAASCTFEPVPVVSYREIEGCVFKEDPVEDIPNQPQKSTLYFRPHSFRTLKITAIGGDARFQEEKFDPGDRISLRFTNIDASLVPTSRDSRRKQLEKELDETIHKSTNFVIMASPKISVSAVLLEKHSHDCIG